MEKKLLSFMKIFLFNYYFWLKYEILFPFLIDDINSSQWINMFLQDIKIQKTQQDFVPVKQLNSDSSLYSTI